MERGGGEPEFWQGLAATRAAVSANSPSDLPRGRGKDRCQECGAVLRKSERCERHRDGGRVTWGQPERVALHLLQQWALDGLDLDRQVELCAPSDTTGTSRGDMAYVLSLLRRWQIPGWEERDLPAVQPVRKGLFE